MATIIIGGGIIGSATAFYLTELGGIEPSNIHIIESSPELVASASGFAGGFLARDWFSAPVASLGALSFDLHAELAAKYDGTKTWGYSKSTSYSLTSSKTSNRGEDWLVSGSRASVGKSIGGNKSDGSPLWLKRADGDGLDMIARGLKVHQPCTPTKLHITQNGDPESIKISSSIAGTHQTSTIPCNQIVLAAGAWTPLVYKTLFPGEKRKIPISPLAGHSLLLRTDQWTDSEQQPSNETQSAAGGQGCHAIFSSTHSPGVKEWSPEIFSRLGGEIYITGLNDARLPLPKLATDRVLEPGKLAIVLEEAKRLIRVDKIAELQVLRQGLCFRPVTDRGTPIVGAARKNVYIAAGHGPWGISMSLGTGKVVAEMLLGKKTSADVSRLGL